MLSDSAGLRPGSLGWSRLPGRVAQLISETPFAAWPTLSGPFWNLWDPQGHPLGGRDRRPAQYTLDDAGRLVIGLAPESDEAEIGGQGSSASGPTTV